MDSNPAKESNRFSSNRGGENHIVRMSDQQGNIMVRQSAEGGTQKQPLGHGVTAQTEESKHEAEDGARNKATVEEGENANDGVIEVTGNPSVIQSNQVLDTSQVLSQA